jgi:hypothetical protein
MLNTDQTPVTPVVLKVNKNLDANDPNIRIRLDYDPASSAGWIRLWNTPAIAAARNSADIADGGNQMFPDQPYSLHDLQYDPQTGEILFFVEGTRANTQTFADVIRDGRANKTIQATIVFNGQDKVHDEVKYEVVTKDSFFYKLQFEPQVRNAIASYGAYSGPGLTNILPMDLPSFSLKRLSDADMVALGIPVDVRNLLGPGAGGITPGFSATIYEDFITGEKQYVIAFRGTDDNIWAGEFDDWATNANQGLGRYAAQYAKAMVIGDALTRVPALQNGHLVYTGHSLGGGLASAAAIVSGVHADTFNAAGLNEATLYLRDIQNKPIPNGLGGYKEKYQGSLANFGLSVLYVDAYYGEYDMLSFVQDNTTLPDAVGNRIKMETPFDLQVGTDAALIGVGLASGETWAAVLGQLLAARTMIKAHGMPTVMYGLLVEEGFFGQIVVDSLGYHDFF